MNWEETVNELKTELEQGNPSRDVLDQEVRGKIENIVEKFIAE